MQSWSAIPPAVASSPLHRSAWAEARCQDFSDCRGAAADAQHGEESGGFLLGVLFLELNGYRFTASEEDAAQAVIGVVAGELDESGYGEFLRANSVRGKGR